MRYYDKLYDAHVANGSGSGSGSGTRPGVVLDAAQPADLPTLDAHLVARVVLEQVRRFEHDEQAEREERTRSAGGVESGAVVAALEVGSEPTLPAVVEKSVPVTVKAQGEPAAAEAQGAAALAHHAFGIGVGADCT